ncbi:hypothetical protein Pcinc_036200, partial [Petrolisthes cinctipes]
VFLAGVFGAILISCFQRRRHSSLANVVKCVLAAFCCISVITCLCVCIFTALHLTQLATMTCHTKYNTLTHHHTTTSPPILTLTTLSSPGLEDDEDHSEGSGGGGGVIEGLEVETGTLDPLTLSQGSGDVVLLSNVTSCACEQRGPGWRRRHTYENLSCLEVNNILPILFVASCVVTAVGAVLSVLVLYLLWSFKNSFYGSAKPHETRPFIFTSNFKNNNNATRNGSNSVSNGDSRFR